MRTQALLKANIEALLRARGQTQKDLAHWCRLSPAWLNKALRDDKRGIPMKYMDRIADFFGIATYQLLQPGLTPLLERRKGTRRQVPDRRIAHASAVLRDPALDVQELIRMVLAGDQDERRALYALLLESRVGGTSLRRRASDESVPESSAEAGHTTAPGPAKSRKHRRASS